MSGQPVRCYPPNLVIECTKCGIAVKTTEANGIGAIAEIVVTPICANQILHVVRVANINTGSVLGDLGQ